MNKDAAGMRNRKYSDREELANTWSHAVGIVLGIVAAYVLLSKALHSSDGWATGSTIIYLFGMLFSYLTSTFYHGFPEGGKKTLLRKFDHSAIYFHIAGTYTPFTLIVLRDVGAWGWSLFVLIWLAAIFGTVLSFRKLKTHSHIETVCFVTMGSAILIAIKPLMDTLNSIGRIDSLFWLIGGGISYIVGALFYSWTKREYMHTVFHLFVLGGSICHIIAIYRIL